MNNKVYLHLPNGDYNDEVDITEVSSNVDFEICHTRCDFVLVTKNKLDNPTYGEIQRFLCNKMKEMEQKQ